MEVDYIEDAPFVATALVGAFMTCDCYAEYGPDYGAFQMALPFGVFGINL